MSRRTISTDRAPAAIGPYAQGVAAGGFVFASMQIALDPKSGQLVGETAPEQARQCLRNIQSIVEAAGARMEDVVKTTVFLQDIGQFAAVNEVYASFFPGERPARGVAEVAALARGALVAVEAIAVLPARS